MEDLKRPKKFCLQLPVVLGLDILAVQPNFLAGGVASGFDSLILSSFLKFLSIIEIFLTNNHQLSEFRLKLVRRLGLGAGVNIFLVRHPKVVTIV